MKVYENVSLSSKTTIALGGKAKYFIECFSNEDIISAVEFSKSKNLPFYILSGGSNIIFPDNDLNIVIINILSKGISKTENENEVIIECDAGENWDSFVEYCISKGLSGVECLSGIPGSVGATPFQNVGAYGQEVKDVINSVKCIDNENFETKIFANEDCEFDYRQSRFKGKDKGKYIITSVVFSFQKNKEPGIKYPELQRQIESIPEFKNTKDLIEKLSIIRNTVISIRKSKSMVLDSNDLNSRSCGSFFMNPVLTETDFKNFINIFQNLNPPHFKSKDKYKIPAAWLIENSGFSKGFRYKGVGISENHSLALVNYEGTSEQIKELSSEIINTVKDKFNIRLHPEPEIFNI